MESSGLLAIISLTLLVSLCSSAATNCSSKGEFSCYTCMGRDMQNCASGETCCRGACFKLQDVKHNVLVKGCVETKEEDASMKVRELNVPLYWANKEKVKGESFFCVGKDYCNESGSISSFFTAVLSLLTLVVIR